MNKPLLAALALVAAGSAWADPGPGAVDHGQAVYRQVVLGDAADRPVDRVAAGGYAQYLVTHLGWSHDQANAAAERIGEPAIEAPVVALDSTAAFDSQERYQRTVLGRSDADIVRERLLRDRRLARASDAR